MAGPVNDHPWSVPVRTHEIGRGVKRRLVADEAVRARIARFLALDALPSLEAEVSVAPLAEGWEVRGDFRARVTQTCGVTLEPFDSDLAGGFSVLTVPPEAASAAPPESAEDQESTLDTPDPPDVVENGTIDLAAYVVEHLSLEIDPFPRKPGVEFEAPAAGVEPSPFAKLSALKRPD